RRSASHAASFGGACSGLRAPHVEQNAAEASRMAPHRSQGIVDLARAGAAEPGSLVLVVAGAVPVGAVDLDLWRFRRRGGVYVSPRRRALSLARRSSRSTARRARAFSLRPR